MGQQLKLVWIGIVTGLFIILIIGIYQYVSVSPNLVNIDVVGEWSYKKDLIQLEEVPPNFKEITNYFIALSEEKGAVHAFEVLKRSPLPPNIDLHLIGHSVGNQLYIQEGLDGIALCTNDFRNACSHSIVIGALLADGLSVFDRVNEVCQKAPGGSGAYTMCFHGFGHGVLAYTGYDFEKAVELCERTGTSEYGFQESAECIGGMVMEMDDGVHDREVWEAQRKNFVDQDRPLSLCQAEYMPKHAKERCYNYITPYMFDAAGAGSDIPTSDIFAKSFSYCETETDSEFRRECYAGFGKEFIVLANNYDIQNIETIDDEKLQLVLDWCDEAGNALGARECKVEVVNSLYWGGENHYAVSIRYCSLITDTTTATACFNQFINNVSFYNQDPHYRTAVCSDIPSEYVAVCKQKLSV
jgi:hypothetical protein